jgi:hypothetical protein
MPKTQELKNLEVDRVDGVDRPATGRNFLLFKSEDGEAIMKGYGALATVAAEVLSKMRADTSASMSVKSAIAMNGLAQVLGESAVFVGKGVPTAPYEFTEPDVDARGPADEKLGSNFVARSTMPADMVGTVALSLAKDETSEVAEKAEKAVKWGKPFQPKKAASDTKDAVEPDADDEKGKKMPWMKSIDAMADAITKQTEAINKMIELAGPAEKVEKAAEQPEKIRPRSRQVDTDDEPVRSVRKSSGGYQPRFDVSFADMVFTK